MVLHVWSVPNMSYAEGSHWPLVEMEKAAQAALDDVQARTRTMHVETDSMSRVFLGSVAERVVRLSPVPVSTIRGPLKAEKAEKSTS